ncbi:MAG: DUF4263 domain-containing protein [Taibaiella sp.]|nr:DUF4263 domain-containing protein [Taibaiella sp.]
MIEFYYDDDKLILKYSPEVSNNWVQEKLARDGSITLKKTFFFIEEDIIQVDDNENMFGEPEPTHFTFALLSKNNYYKVKRGIVAENLDIYIHKDIIPSVNFFVIDTNISIFRVMRKIVNQDIYIGGENKNSISKEEFEHIIKNFPTNHEKKKYIEARVSSVLKNYFENIGDTEKSYVKYINRKQSKRGDNLFESFKNYEAEKYSAIYNKLLAMLHSEDEYNEKQWQEEILEIILLLYPKYLFVFKEVPIHQRMVEGIKERFLDFLLIDSNGNCDIIEIKKPFLNAIMTKSLYRDNYIPLRELSGTVMQIEKYIYYFNRWSEGGEMFLTNKYKNKLPDDFNIKITNPSGIVIMGRENNLSLEQKRDFEIIKRKYKNVVDIITYDSLLERLKFTIQQIKRI